MTDEAVLIAACCARPDDDTPRLVIAGDPFAEAVRGAAVPARLSHRWPGVREGHLPDTPRTHRYSHRGRAAAAQ